MSAVTHTRNISDYYVLQRELGRGTFSIVYAAHSKAKDATTRKEELESHNINLFLSGEEQRTPLNDEGTHRSNKNHTIFPHVNTNAQTEEVAIKVINKQGLSPPQIARVFTEIELLSHCKHPYIINLIEWFEDPVFIYMVMDLKTGGELFDRIIEYGHFQEEEAIFILKQIGSAVQYLHHKEIVHRDLKPENMLFADKTPLSRICIADFGFARYVKDGEDLTTPCGTPGYVAPEIVNYQAYKKSVDMWSLGVIAYTLLCGFPPFYSDDDETLLELIAEAKFDFPAPYWNDISDSAKDLVLHLLEKDPLKRCSADQFMEHPWIRGTITRKRQLEQPSKQVWNKSELKNILNKSIEVQRDGTFLKSASESTLWKRREKKGARATRNSNPLASSTQGTKMNL